MSTSSNPKATILFPDAWAADSFLLRLRRSSEWEYQASSDERHIKAKPKGAREFIGIYLNKAGNGKLVYLHLNAEKLGEGLDKVWDEIQEHARRYRS